MVECPNSKVKEEGDPKSLSYDHYCPDVPTGVKCPSDNGTTDNTTTTTGTVMREYFDLARVKVGLVQYRVLRCTGADITHQKGTGT